MFLKNIFIVHSLRFAQILSICSAKIFFHVASPEIFFSFFFSEKSIFSSFY